MRFEAFSPQQLRALTWWCPSSPHRHREGVIADGAVRSGKTLCLSLSFAAWAMAGFSGQSFALCGHTLGALRRNLLPGLLEALEGLGFGVDYSASQNLVELSLAGRSNRFYLFGGRDESSAPLIQGVTLAGVLLDEAALMPRSFVEQALARCSVEGSKFWFACNPEHPFHWFYREWILKAKQKNLLRLRFSMEDNPSLSPAILARYRSLYSGSFYRRFVLGEWAAPSGLVYPMFEAGRHVAPPPAACRQYYVSCDYGSVNPTSMGLWGLCGERWHRLREYYYDSRAAGRIRTDEEHYAALERLCAGLPVTAVVVDPSAVSLMETIRRHGRFPVLGARNELLPGIARVAAALSRGELLFAPSCRDTLREFTLYRWDERARCDAPVPEFDHAMDDIRYFVSTLFTRQSPAFYALAPERGPGNPF